MNRKSIVLISGGLDSALSLIKAKAESEIHFSLTFDYGQRSHEKETRAAANICAYFGIEHKVVPLPFLSELMGHPFFDHSISCPEPDMNKLDDLKITMESAKAVWVPNRNGIFLNIAAGLAEIHCVDALYVGFNAEEAVTFPDNSRDYVDAMNNSLSHSTLNKVRIQAPTINMVKKDILKELIQEDFPLQHLWSCYNGEENMCGKCESCQRLKRAFLENGYEDILI